MKLLTKAIHDKLLENRKKQDAVRGTEDEIDFKPVIKLFTPDANCTWLFSAWDVGIFPPSNPTEYQAR